MNNFNSFFQESLDERQKKETYRSLISLKPIHQMHIQYKGKEYINFSSNDYLGLSKHPILKQKSQQYIDEYGVGSTASRLVTGNFDYQQMIEEKLARFLGTEAALIFASGWQANVAIIACLLENLPKPVWVVTDKLNHASLHYGCKSGQSKQIRYRHNDMDHLQQRLETIPNGIGTTLIITETIFSMDGDQSDLQKLRQIADHYNAFLFLDDAHASGVLGEQGRGLAPAYADLAMGTFSKAWGGFGAYIGGSKALCDWLVNYCSGFIHTTALPPSVNGGILAALELIPSLDKERLYLQQQSKYVREELNSIGIDTGETISHIIPVIVGSAEKSLQIAGSLQEKGIWATAIRPPTVPMNSSRLRVTLSAAHRSEEIEYLLESLKTLI